MPWANQWTMDLDVIWIQEWRCAKPICGDWTDHEKYGFCCEQWIWMRLKIVDLAKVVMFNEKHDDKALSLADVLSKNCKYNRGNVFQNWKWSIEKKGQRVIFVRITGSWSNMFSRNPYVSSGCVTLPWLISSGKLPLSVAERFTTSPHFVFVNVPKKNWHPHIGDVIWCNLHQIPSGNLTT